MENTIKLTPFIRVTGEDGELVEITRLTYKYSEEYDDECHLALQSRDPFIADTPNMQEGKKLSVEWGYLETKQSVKRQIYIFECQTQYMDGGIMVNIVGHEKFTLAKMNKSGTGKARNKTSKNTTQELILGFDVLNKMQIAIDGGNKELEAMLKAAGIKIESNNLQLTQGGWVDSKSADIVGNQANKDIGLEYNKGSQVTQEGTPINKTMGQVYHTSTVPSYQVLRKYLDKLPGGPYVIDSRDDSLTIRTRDFSKSPIRSYAYMGEDGELLEFIPQTKNRQHSTGASRTSAIGWDVKSKTATKSTSTKKKGAVLADNNVGNQLITGLWNVDSFSYYDKDWMNPRTYDPYAGAQQKPKKPKPPTVTVIKHESDSAKRERFIRNQEAIRDTYEKNQREANEPTIAGLGGKYDPDKVEEGSAEMGSWDRDGWLPNKDSNNRNPVRIDNTYNNVTDRSKPLWKGAKAAPEGTPEKTTYLGSEPRQKVSATASNKRENAELENNPATARMIGNPYIETGSIINFMNVAKKHEGNYYVSEVEHQVGEDGYITMIYKMVREGTKKSTTQVKTKLASISASNPNIRNVSSKPTKPNDRNQQKVLNNKVAPARTPEKQTTRQDNTRVTTNRKGFTDNTLIAKPAREV